MQLKKLPTIPSLEPLLPSLRKKEGAIKKMVPFLVHSDKKILIWNIKAEHNSFWQCVFLLKIRTLRLLGK